MSKKLKLIVIFFCFNQANCQNFITLDIDTYEFIQDVNYHLFFKKVEVFSNICENNKITTLPTNVVFDSITFSKINYKTLGLKKEELSKTILLTKNIIDLDEIVITSSKKNELILGERNRFVKRKSNSISKGLDYGIVFQNKLNTNLVIDKIVFYIDKIKYKTAYKINFYEFNQVPLNIGHQKAKIGKLIFSTDTLFLLPKQKDEVEVTLTKNDIFLDENPIFISIELNDNYDENDNKVLLSFEDSSKIKFQLSNQANYYAKTVNIMTGILSPDLININAMINYDFAYQFFSKPHKSSIVAPAILLYTRKVE